MPFTQAQQVQNPYSKILMGLIHHADNDFDDAIGEIVGPAPGMDSAVIFTCNGCLGMGSEGFLRDNAINAVYYYFSIKKTDPKAKEVIRQTNLLIDIILQEANGFTEKRTQNGAGDYTILLKDKGGFYTLETTDSSNDSGELEYNITIFGKTAKEIIKAGEDMKEKN